MTAQATWCRIDGASSNAAHPSPTIGLAANGVGVLDPSSSLIAHRAELGSGTIVYSGVIVSSDQDSTVRLGERCVLYPGCVLEAGNGGLILIGDEVELGPGGVTIRAIGSGDMTTLEDQVRVNGNCDSPVRVSWVEAVLKGAGIADRVTLAQGEVRSCRASFNEATTERQSSYHPPAN